MLTDVLHMEDDHYVKEPSEDWCSSNGHGDRMLQHLLQYLKEWKERGDDRPFFASYPFSAPHWPLQAPKEYIDHYRSVHDDGPEALCQKRLADYVKLGMFHADTKPYPVVADEVSGWEEMMEQERECRAEQWRRMQSDNGAEGAAYEALPMVKGPLMQRFGQYHNNGMRNFQGHELVPMRGKRMSRWVRGQEERVHERDHVHGWELCDREAIRKGNWKADLVPKPKGRESWQLYELSKDTGEIEDLAEK